MKEYATCPYCGAELERVETLERDYRPMPAGSLTKFRVDLENWCCSACRKGFDVEAYYLSPPMFFGDVKEWGEL